MKRMNVAVLKGLMKPVSRAHVTAVIKSRSNGVTQEQLTVEDAGLVSEVQRFRTSVSRRNSAGKSSFDSKVAGKKRSLGSG